MSPYHVWRIRIICSYCTYLIHLTIIAQQKEKYGAATKSTSKAGNLSNVSLAMNPVRPLTLQYIYFPKIKELIFYDGFIGCRRDGCSMVAERSIPSFRGLRL